MLVYACIHIYIHVLHIYLQVHVSPSDKQVTVCFEEDGTIETYSLPRDEAELRPRKVCAYVLGRVTEADLWVLRSDCGGSGRDRAACFQL